MLKPDRWFKSDLWSKYWISAYLHRTPHSVHESRRRRHCGKRIRCTASVYFVCSYSLICAGLPLSRPRSYHREDELPFVSEHSINIWKVSECIPIFSCISHGLDSSFPDNCESHMRPFLHCGPNVSWRPSLVRSGSIFISNVVHRKHNLNYAFTAIIT